MVGTLAATGSADSGRGRNRTIGRLVATIQERREDIYYTGPFLDKLAIVPGAAKTINTWDPAAPPLIVNRTRFQ